MSKRAIKALALALMLTVIMAIVSGCGDRPPDGKYLPIDDTTAAIIQYIAINGNNLTMAMPLAGTTTVKYTYNSKTGAITITDGLVGWTSMEYKSGSIFLVNAFATIEFRKK